MLTLLTRTQRTPCHGSGNELSLSTSGDPAIGFEKIDPATSIRYRECWVDPKTIMLCPDVPNFKAHANEAGVVQKLQGKFHAFGTGPLSVWERVSGTLELISGRHRRYRAIEDEVRYVLAHIVRESDGYSLDMAIAHDAWSNIRENQGTVRDYVRVMKSMRNLTKADAEITGILRNRKGRLAWQIAQNGTDYLIGELEGGSVSDGSAAAIATAAPNDLILQQVGLLIHSKGGEIKVAIDAMKCAELPGMLPQWEQRDLFGVDDTALQFCEKISNLVHSKCRDIESRIRAANGAASNPDLARSMGVVVDAPKSVKEQIRLLKIDLRKWKHWWRHADCLQEIKKSSQ